MREREPRREPRLGGRCAGKAAAPTRLTEEQVERLLTLGHLVS
jgi:hypothetical protein